MKSIDKILRAWRTTEALRHLPRGCSRVLDVGCGDGYLLERIGSDVPMKAGLDPRLGADKCVNGSKLYKGSFPEGVKLLNADAGYDAIFALAVLEHFSDTDLSGSANIIPKLLSTNGRFIVTVPHPWVDKILDILMALRLIDGQATEEHHGFKPDEVVKYFGSSLKLVTRRTFQLGLNNVFVFEKLS